MEVILFLLLLFIYSVLDVTGIFYSKNEKFINIILEDHRQTRREKKKFKKYIDEESNLKKYIEPTKQVEDLSEVPDISDEMGFDLTKAINMGRKKVK